MMLLNDGGKLREPRDRLGTDRDMDGDVAACNSAGAQ